MRSKLINTGIAISLSSMVFMACKKTPEVGILETGEFGETVTPLKDAADFPMGTAIGYTPMLNDTKYSEVVKRDFDAVTFEYEMKHGAIVQNNGSMNFTRADALVAAVGTMEVFGHTLGWHQNQNATYVKSFAGITVQAATELATNPGFENGLTGWSVFNTGNPAGNAQVTAGSGTNEVRTGSGSMKVVNPTAYPGNQWRVQVSSSAFATTPGKQYTISYYVKAASGGGSIRLSSGPSAPQYQGDQAIGTAWQLVSWTITASLASTTFLFDMGQAANTYYIDDVSVKEVVTAPSGAQVAAKVDEALGTFITAIVNRYKNKVKAWDVVNELFTENGSIRNNANTLPSGNVPADLFVWSEYLGRDYAFKAFKYAEAADPTALLYINDYNLESSPAKLDSLIKFVAELKTRGAKVDGIGTQMHVTRNSSVASIDAMMQKLAATGLKIRISELDVKTVLSNSSGQATPQMLGYQASMYKYIVNSYMKYIPAAQRAGITIWGVNDRNSWLYSNGTEFPLLYDNDYNKKPAYGAVLQALRGQ
jgi:endo-1,4-beta-xylanase